MARIGLDLFDFSGKSHLVCVDRWSGYPMFAALNSTSSANVIKTLQSWFNVLGWPRSIRSDGGSQFRGKFSSFCDNYGIKHELASPYNPQSNDLAESGVKIVKNMLQKCMGEGKDIQRVLYEWRNMPKQHGYSPAQLMFGRSQQLLLPQPASAFQPIDYEQAAAKLDEKFHSSLSHYDRDKVQLPPFLPGEAVFVQCDKTKKWEKKGEILEKRPDGLSYLVDIDGRVAIRSRAFLKPVFKEGQGGAQDHVSLSQDQGEFHSLSAPPLRPLLGSRKGKKKNVYHHLVLRIR